MFKKLTLLLLLVLALKGCTRDDICPEGTATTPNLIIVFADVATPNIRKEVKTLSVQTDYEEAITVLSGITTDSIALPLNVNSDTTKYRFIKTTITDTDTIVKTDRIFITYLRKDIYVNRACGFREEFYSLNPQLQTNNEGNWIENIIVNRDTVVDESQAHLTLLH